MPLAVVNKRSFAARGLDSRPGILEISIAKDPWWAFLQSARGLETIPGSVVIMAARNLRADSIMRHQKETGIVRHVKLRGRLSSPPSDLQLILEHDDPVVVPKAALSPLAGCDVDEAEYLWKLAVQRGGFSPEAAAEILKEEKAKTGVGRLPESHNGNAKLRTHRKSPEIWPEHGGRRKGREFVRQEPPFVRSDEEA
jgi:hypothetical protein